MDISDVVTTELRTGTIGVFSPARHISRDEARIALLDEGFRLEGQPAIQEQTFSHDETEGYEFEPTYITGPPPTQAEMRDVVHALGPDHRYGDLIDDSNVVLFDLGANLPAGHPFAPVVAGRAAA